MRLLLDTHVFVWSATRVNMLPSAVIAALNEPENEIFVSAVSAYEIEYKRDRDVLLRSLPAELDPMVTLQGMAWLPITEEHAAAAARLPPYHRDPWDRILVAQASLDGMQLVTIDRKLAAYDVPILW